MHSPGKSSLNFIFESQISGPWDLFLAIFIRFWLIFVHFCAIFIDFSLILIHFLIFLWIFISFFSDFEIIFLYFPWICCVETTYTSTSGPPGLLLDFSFLRPAFGLVLICCVVSTNPFVVLCRPTHHGLAPLGQYLFVFSVPSSKILASLVLLDSFLVFSFLKYSKCSSVRVSRPSLSQIVVPRSSFLGSVASIFVIIRSSFAFRVPIFRSHNIFVPSNSSFLGVFGPENIVVP